MLFTVVLFFGRLEGLLRRESLVLLVGCGGGVQAVLRVAVAQAVAALGLRGRLLEEVRVLEDVLVEEHFVRLLAREALATVHKGLEV